MMKRAIGILLAITLIFALLTGCGKPEKENPITEVKVTLPCSTGARAIVEGEAVLSTQVYLLARACFEKLETYDTDSFDAQGYSKLLAETSEAFRIAEALCASFEHHADAFAEVEENGSVPQEKATFEVLSAPADRVRSFPFVPVAYAEEKSPAVRYAEELTRTFDSAKNGQKLKAIAEKYGTDVKKAKVMLEQAQAILEGAAYEDQAAFENKCYEVAVETKAAASAIGFGVAVAASGGIAAGGAVSVTGIMEAGGLVMNGVNAVIDMGTAVTIHATHGEGNEYTAAWEKTGEMFAPVNAVFAIGGGIQNIKDFRDPEKTADMVNNAAQAFMVGVGFARDYIQDGTILGVSSNIVDGYREIIVRCANTADPDGAKEVLSKTGISETAPTETGPEAAPDGHLGIEADNYIAAMGELIDPEDPVDVDTFLQSTEEAFQQAMPEGYTEGTDATEAEPETDPAKPETDSDISGVYNISELRFVQAGISAPLDDRLHVMLNGTEITIEGETDFINQIVGTYDAQSMTATFYGDQSKMIVTFDGHGNLHYASYNTNDGLLYIEIDASASDAEPTGGMAFEGGIDAFMGEWHDAAGKRTIMQRNGDRVIVKEPDLEWYDGDVCCTEYTAVLDEAAGTLTLHGITTWVSDPGSDERRLELDASGSGATYTVTEVSGGKITAITISGNTLTR